MADQDSSVTAAETKWQQPSPDKLALIERALGIATAVVPAGKCQCGCGLQAPIARRSNSMLGHVRGQPVRFLVGHNKRLLAPRGISVAPNGCWVWTGRTDENGYGRVGSRAECVHRLAYQAVYGEFAPELFVCHECDNPPCVNPSHLFLGTATDNNRDRHTKGRSKNLFASDETHPARRRAGEQHWHARLSADDVRRIRAEHDNGRSQTMIGAQFNVHPSTISRIVRREWRKEVA